MRACDRRRIGHGRDQNAIVSFRNLADRERGPAVDGSSEKIDLVLLEQFFGLANGDRRIGLFVLEQQFERTTCDTARRIDLLDRELGTPTHLFPDRSVAARQWRDDPDFDRIGCVCVQPEAECECGDRTA